MLKVLLPVFLFSFSSWATVDMKNANFADEWVHMKIPTTGFELNFIGNYNSRTLHNGISGFGWCTEYETNLEKLGGNALKIQICGAGAENFFYPDGFDKKDLAKQVSSILSSYKRKSPGLSKKAEQELMEQLSNDPKKRSEFSEKYGVVIPLTNNQKFVSSSSSEDYILFKKGNYYRYRPDGVVETYSSSGNLLEKRDKNSNFQRFKYSGNKLVQVINQSGQQLSFLYYENDKVKEVRGPSGLKAEFRYKGSDLVWVKNAWKNEYNFSYDDLHNITKISYPDGTTRELKYDQKKDWVISFQDREKCIETYDYQFDKNDPRNHYWTHLKKTCGKEVVNVSKFEFWFKERPLSGKYLARVRTEINKEVKDVTYHPEFSRPIRLVENNKTYTYSYYKNGLIRTKSEDGVTSHFKYDSKTNKISEVRSGDQKSKFVYDKKGNLTFAANSSGQKVKLIYDKNGRISGLMDQAKRVVRIKYNSNFGKPAVVEVPGIGSIKVVYDSTGNIKKAHSSAGPAVDVQVASAFNNLLEVVKPAGVDLGL